jgi:hypothetical protein
MAATVWTTRGSVTPEKINARLDAALQYLGLGWAVVPLHWIDQGVCSCGNHECLTPGKHPYPKFARHGVHSASKDTATVREWYTKEPRLNLGIACGEISGIVVLDVDPRNGGDDTLFDIEKRHGKASDTPTAITGGGGQHFVYKYSAGNVYKSPGRGLDVLSNGKLFVVAPSSHKSGNTYEWEAVADPLDGFAIADAPLWIVSQNAKPKKPSGNLSFLHGGVGYLDPSRVADLRSALEFLKGEEYAEWIGVGQALHSTNAPEAFEIWDSWSQKASNYENGKTQEKWDTFTDDRGLHVESIFAWAKDAGWKGNEFSGVPKALPKSNQQSSDNGSEKTDSGNTKGIHKTGSDSADAGEALQGENHTAETSGKKKSKGEKHYEDAVPSHLLTIPGVLGELVTQINKTAYKTQPQFAVQTALALASVVMGRRYVAMPRQNFTSQYFMAVGESGCGKEFGKQVIETVLKDCGLQSLLGPSGYTSESGVFSALAEKPCHISLMDELGATLRDAANGANTHRRESFTILIGLWGRLQGEFTPLGRSLLSQPKNQAENLRKSIECPAITVLGMSTPGKFYEAITDEAIEGGFISRLLIVQTNLHDVLPNWDAQRFVTPPSVKDWVTLLREPLPTEGNLAGIDISYVRPVLREMMMSDEATKIYREYTIEAQMRQKELRKRGFGEMENRSAEKALRLAPCIEKSANALSEVIQGPAMQWAVDYVRFYTAQAVKATQENMSTSQFSKWCKHALRALTSNADHHGLEYEKGLTAAQIMNSSPTLRELKPRDLADVLNSLGQKGEIEMVPKTEGKRGRQREAFRLIRLADREED